MDICLEMMILHLFFFVAFMIVLGEGQNRCHESRCGAHGPAVRFPFRLNSQPDYCGYPGFHLSCTETNDTVLELPISVKFFVKDIDYTSQVIQLCDPDRCLLRRLRGLNLSSSPFLYNKDEDEYEDFLGNFTVLKCPAREIEDCFSMIPCLSGPGYQFYAFRSGMLVNEDILSCTKMYTLRSIPEKIVSGLVYTSTPEFGVRRVDNQILELKWSRPHCGLCETKGKKCKWKKNSTGSETECFRDDAKDASSKLVTTGVIFSVFLLLLATFALYRVYSHGKIERENQAKIEKFLEDYRNFKPTRYSYADIKRITNQFVEKLGQGAYGTVFKGKLSNEIYVAVKILNTSKGNGEEFINEVGTMGKIHHINVVRLVGFCADGFRRALVYEFLPNGSLFKFISLANIKDNLLGWDKLQDIAFGVAKGIEYLHQGCDQRILHFDIKPYNILLDENFNPKISDFGLSKLCSKDQSIVSMTTVKGTIGYIAPEVFSRNFGNVSYKSDVYSFGMLLLEIVGGRKNIDDMSENTNQVYFPEWIYNFLEQREDLRIFIDDDGDAKIAKKLAIVGLWCIQWYPIDRPSMKTVIQMLEGEGDKLTMPPNPFSSTCLSKVNAKALNHELEVIPKSN